MHARARSLSIALNCSLSQGIFRIFCEKRTQHKIDDSHYGIEDVQFTGNNLYTLNSYSRKHFMLAKYFRKIYISNHFLLLQSLLDLSCYIIHIGNAATALC